MKLRTCRWYRIKAYDHIYARYWHGRVPTEESSAEINQRRSIPRKVWACAVSICLLTCNTYPTGTEHCSTSHYGRAMWPYVQPAVNRQPGYRWEDSQSKPKPRNVKSQVNIKCDDPRRTSEQIELRDMLAYRHGAWWESRYMSLLYFGQRKFKSDNGIKS